MVWIELRFHNWFVMTVYYKMWQILLQNATSILLQNAAKVYYKLHQVFITKCHSFITKCDSYYKMRRFYYKFRQYRFFIHSKIIHSNLINSTCWIHVSSFHFLSFCCKTWKEGAPLKVTGFIFEVTYKLQIEF